MIGYTRNLLLLCLACALLISAAGDVASAKPKSAADKKLYEKARKACSGPSYTSGTLPFINYAGGWFRCVEPRSSR